MNSRVETKQSSTAHDWLEDKCGETWEKVNCNGTAREHQSNSACCPFTVLLFISDQAARSRSWFEVSLSLCILSHSRTMFRTAAVRALRAAARASVLRQTPLIRQTPVFQSKVAPVFALPSIRCYSAPAGLSRDEVQGRIMDLLKNFDKVGYSCWKELKNFD